MFLPASAAHAIQYSLSFSKFSPSARAQSFLSTPPRQRLRQGLARLTCTPGLAEKLTGENKSGLTNGVKTPERRSGAFSNPHPWGCFSQEARRMQHYTPLVHGLRLSSPASPVSCRSQARATCLRSRTGGCGMMRCVKNPDQKSKIQQIKHFVPTNEARSSRLLCV